MKRFAACLFVSAFAASSAFGGTVSFDKMGPNTYDVLVASAGYEAFDGVDLVIGTETAGVGLSFVLAQSFKDTATLPTTPPGPMGIYPIFGGSDVWGAGFNGFVTWSAPLLVGTLTVDLGGNSEALVQVSSDWEVGAIGGSVSALWLAGVPEGVEGSVNVPEPATLMLLGFGGLAMLRRRKA